MYLKDLLSKKVISIGINSHIREALKIFNSHNIKTLPVTSGGKKLVGIIHSDEITSSQGEDLIVAKFLSNEYIKIDENETIHSAAQKLLALPHFSIAYIVDREEKLKGFISRNDLLNYLGSFRDDGVLPLYNHVVESDLDRSQIQEILSVSLDYVKDGIIIVDSNLKIIYANKAYLKVLGIQPHRVIGRYITEIEPNAKIIEVLKSGEPVIDKTIYIKSLNITVVATIKPITRNERVVAAISTFQNITEVINLGNQLEKEKAINKRLKEEKISRINLPKAFESIIGVSEKLIKELTIAARVAVTDASVLITGESGTGKELVAKAIHQSSHRKDMPFVEINCSTIPENLIESELFGYEEGAFSGAKKGGKKGKIEIAHGGTLFLDELGEMPLTMQPKLLRFLQEGTFEKVGGEKTIRVDIRIIAATNKELQKMVEVGSFRKDLLYRMNIFTITLPPLRERKGDILPLIHCFLSHYNMKYNKKLSFSDKCIKLFFEYNWPGNVRELKNVVEHAVILASGNSIVEANLPVYLQNIKISQCPIEVSLPFKSLDEAIGELEKDYIIKALEQSKFNKTKAMELLGVSRRTFYNKLKTYNLDV